MMFTLLASVFTFRHPSRPVPQSRCLQRDNPVLRTRPWIRWFERTGRSTPTPGLDLSKNQGRRGALPRVSLQRSAAPGGRRRGRRGRQQQRVMVPAGAKLEGRRRNRATADLCQRGRRRAQFASRCSRTRARRWGLRSARLSPHRWPHLCGRRESAHCLGVACPAGSGPGVRARRGRGPLYGRRCASLLAPAPPR